jgi:hypothetical protein
MKAKTPRWAKKREPLKEGQKLSFCTNTMIDRGTVFHVRNEGGNAIIESVQTWWAMVYSKKDTSRAGEILGKIELKTVPGTLTKRYAVGNLREGCG